MRSFLTDLQERRAMMKLFLIAMFMAVSGCGGSDPCDQCYDDDYYYEHPYYCQECLQDKGNEASSLVVEKQTND